MTAAGPDDERAAAARALKEATAPVGPGAAEQAMARLREASAALLEGVKRALPTWAEGVAAGLLSAWGVAKAAVLRARAEERPR